MSKSVASESNDRHEAKETSKKRGGDDGEDEDEEGIIELPPTESSETLMTVSTVTATTDQFMHTPEFRIHFVELVHVQTLMALRVATKGFNAAADALIDEGVRSGDLMVHYGKDIDMLVAVARKERCKLATRVIFFLNITKVGKFACYYAANLVVVDIPEGVEEIRWNAFAYCSSLTTVSFPRTLRFIGQITFWQCDSLENVDLLHTNLQELGEMAFYKCSELKSMTIPHSLQTLGEYIFVHCYKLVPSNIRTNDNDAVVAHLRSQQQIS